MKRLLIEEGLPFEAINAASHREKSGNSPDHPRRLHLWWARRPLAMSRAIVLGSIVPAPTEESERRRLFQTIENCALFKDAGVRARIEPLREFVRSSFPESQPTVLDCFAGGGAIPLEALRLGCETTAIDLNPVAHLIQRCMLEYPQRFGKSDEHGRNPLSDDVRSWGTKVGTRVFSSLAAAYPQGEGGRPIVWFWSRTMRCQNPSCGIDIPLLKTWWIARARNSVWLEPVFGDDGIELVMRRDDDEARINRGVGTVTAATVTCPRCSATVAAKDVRQHGKAHGFGLRLNAVLEATSSGRTYRLPRPSDMVGVESATRALRSLEETESGRELIPDEAIDPTKYRRLQSLVFGIDRYRDLFTDRQLLVLGTLSSAIHDVHTEMLEEGMGSDRARAVASYLGLAVDRIADYNSAFCSWNLGRELTRNTYARQSISMIWDFNEIDPFADIPGNWAAGVSSIAAAIERCADTGSRPARVIRGNAQDLSQLSDSSFDAVVVDPPYYDAVQYGDVSDFFYVWLKRSVGFLYPDLFATPLTPKAQEVIENTADRRSTAYISSDEFEKRLARSISEMRRVVKPEGVVTIVFAHTESDAWERLLRSLLSADLVVSASWPMQSEMGSRSTANLSAVLGSSVVLVCRPRVAAETAFYDDVVRELDTRIGERLDEFERLGLRGADYLISAIGPAFEVFGKYESVVRLNGDEVSVGELLALARRTVARHAMSRLLGSEALSAVDDVSLFYLTWRWAYSAARIPVDEAQKLGKAFNVEASELDGVDGLVETARDGYSLRGPDDRRRIKLGVVPSLIDVLHVACKLFEQGRRTELADVLASSGFAEEPAFWATGRAIAESLPDGDRERVLLVNLLGGQSQTVEAARKATPNEVLRLFEVNT